jgi:hypothetical protein
MARAARRDPAGDRRNLDVEHLARHLLDDHLVLQQVGAHLVGIGAGLSILLIATIIGTPAALAWLIASTVWGITESSAATTSITISVTCAPRARIEVKAAWPGVSRKLSSCARLGRHLIGADMLRDAAGLARDDIGLADRVEQRGLAVVDMAHDRDHRRRGRSVSSASTSVG